ncbi:hypothetical protein [Bradyrhizobium sp. NAS96.2]|uniref:hypothetical protein n=1 Tax=Bradyrhizobium sp. NAS96.2 TaxID=1680160 RepID=UPI000B1C357E
MSLSITSSVSSRSSVRGLVPLCAAVGAYLFYLSAGEILLRDSDTEWQIKVGQWILEHGAMPTSDVFSFTRFGERGFRARGCRRWRTPSSMAAIGPGR